MKDRINFKEIGEIRWVKTNKNVGQELSKFEMHILIKILFIFKKIPFIANAVLTGKDTKAFYFWNLVWLDQSRYHKTAFLKNKIQFLPKDTLECNNVVYERYLGENTYP